MAANSKSQQDVEMMHPSMAPYDEYIAKHQKLVAKRKQPWPAAKPRIEAAATPEDVINILSGDAVLVPQIESKLWFSLAEIVSKAECAQIRIAGVEWSILDLLLTGSSLTEEWPMLLLGQTALAFDRYVVVLDKRNWHAAQFFQASYDDWANDKDASVEQLATWHFQFGFSLLVVDHNEEAATVLLTALGLAPEATQAEELLNAILAQAAEPLKTLEGETLTAELIARVKKAGLEGAPTPTAKPSFTKGTSSQADDDEAETGKRAAAAAGGLAPLVVIGAVVAAAVVVGTVWLRLRMRRAPSSS